MEPGCREVRRPGDRAWVDEAVRKVEADSNRSADTHLLVFPLPEAWDVDLPKPGAWSSLLRTLLEPLERPGTYA